MELNVVTNAPARRRIPSAPKGSCVDPNKRPDDMARIITPELADKRANVAAVIQEIFEKDIRRRVKIKNVSVFNQVRDYVINNFGATTSLASIQSDLESKQDVRVKRETLARRVARSASSALESWNATSSSGTRRWATHTFRSP